MSVNPAALSEDEIRELVDAALALNPYLSTSYDPAPAQTAIMLPQAAGLRQAADEIDARDAAIYRFRRALAATRGRSW